MGNHIVSVRHLGVITRARLKENFLEKQDFYCITRGFGAIKVFFICTGHRERGISMDKQWKLSQEELLQQMNSSMNGLTAEEAKKRLEQYGYNKLQEGKRKGVLQVFAEQFADLLVIILIIAAICLLYTSYPEPERKNRSLHSSCYYRWYRSGQTGRYGNKQRLPCEPSGQRRESKRIHDSSGSADLCACWHNTERSKRHHLGQQDQPAAHRRR